MVRTLEILKDYHGSYDATLILNSLLGLLIVPRETSLRDKIPNDPIRGNLQSWGIYEESILDYGDEKPTTIRDLVRNLRNSVAHFQIEPIQGKNMVEGFRFNNRSGFQAKITLQELRTFVEKLSEHLKKQY